MRIVDFSAVDDSPALDSGTLEGGVQCESESREHQYADWAEAGRQTQGYESNQSQEKAEQIFAGVRSGTKLFASPIRLFSGVSIYASGRP